MIMAFIFSVRNDASFWIGGKYSGRMVFTDGSAYVPVPIQDLDDICYRLRGNDRVDGRECSSEFPYICQIIASMVHLKQSRVLP